MNPIFNDHLVPIYVQIAELLRGRIMRRFWRTGERLPAMEDLAEQFQVSRVTIRKSIGLLVDEGLLVTEQGRGTTVRQSGNPARFLHTTSAIGALSDIYRDSKAALLNIQESTSAPQLETGEGRPCPNYFHMRRIHSAEGKPYCVISIYMDKRIFDKAPERFRNELVIPILLSMPDVEIKKAHQTFMVGTADIEEARHLSIPIISPVVRVRRVFISPAREAIYLAEVAYRGDFIKIDMDMEI